MLCSCLVHLIGLSSIFHPASSIPALAPSQQPLSGQDLESRLLDLKISLDTRIAKYDMDMTPHLEALEASLTSNTNTLNILNTDLSLIKLSLSTATETSSLNSMSILLETVSEKLLDCVDLSVKVEMKLQDIQTHTQAISKEIDHMKAFMLDNSAKLDILKKQIEPDTKGELLQGVAMEGDSSTRK